MKIILTFFFTLYISNISFANPPVTDNHIKVDQFGYRATDKKVAVISNPVTGYNNTSPFTPGNNYQVRRWTDDTVVFSGSPVVWNSGATHSQSGDKVWWFDFSSVTVVGSYYVFDVTNNAGSYRFEINDLVYLTIMKQAQRVFYYQRCGTAKSLPYAQTGWTDAACHIGNLQDFDCRLYNNLNASTSKNLSGGWHDAGDYNKYVNFTFGTLLDMLLAYKENPAIWTDDFNIPESGNGVPDLLDEIKYELDWMLKMQSATGNGSVLSIVGVANFGSASPPSADHNQRVYGPASTSASLTAAALFSLAAIQFKNAGQITYGNTLQTAAISANNWAVANPNVTFYNSGSVGAGEQEVDDYGRLQRKMAASVFLYALTNSSTYKTFFESNYTQMHMMQWTFAYPFETDVQDMMLYYTSLSGITPSVATAIKNAYANSMKTSSDNLPAYTNKTDAYRAFLTNQNYTWGSNTTKGHAGSMYITMNVYNLDTVNKINYREAALGYLNYFNGVNPTAFCYLTNMSSYGAENSVNEIYHSWFENGSVLWDRVGISTYGPAPGFVPGGPNPSYALDGCCPSGCGGSNSLCNSLQVTPPLGQPIQKSYKDWNTSWPQNSWTVTEPGIYTQAAYLRLVSSFVNSLPTIQVKAVIEGLYDTSLNKMNRRDTVRAYLRNNSAPYTIVDSSKAVFDSLTFISNFVFTNASSGTYYIVVKHRNSIETWSKAGGEAYTYGTTLSYNFTTDSSKTYGNNVKNVDNSPLTYSIYSGDAGQDGNIDVSDLVQIYNDQIILASGYLPTDINGDNFTDVSDLVIAYNNSLNLVNIARP